MTGKQPETMDIRRLQRADVPAVLSIQFRSPEISQWSSADYERAADGEMLAYVAVRCSNPSDREISGFLIARRLVDDVEILNFAVAPDFRRQGVGAALLEYVFRSSELTGVDGIFLEVRASNDVALQFYKSHGFEATGTRRKYYTLPVEDALLLYRSIRARRQVLREL